MNPNLVTLIRYIPNWNANNGKNLADAIRKMTGVAVRDLKYSDLILPANQCNGVYVFQQGRQYQIIEYDNKTHQPIIKDEPFWYVGKASSRALVDRIGAHVAPRIDDYMNILLKNIAWLLSGISSQKDFLKGDLLTVSQKSQYIEQALSIIQDLRLKVVVFDATINPNNDQNDISLAEKYLKDAFHPYLNDVNRKKRNITIK